MGIDRVHYTRGLGPTQRLVMPLMVPPFSFYKVPEPHEMAAKLVLGILEEERNDAYELLVENILPVKLATIDRHPRPQRLTAVVYRELARLLSGKPPNMRLHALRLCAFDVFIHYMERETLSLAITRFVLDRPELNPEALGHWRSVQVTELLVLNAEDISDISERALENVAQWKTGIVDSYPAEWQRYKDIHQRVVHGLLSAATGNFERAGGQLHDFLRERGLSPDSL